MRIGLLGAAKIAADCIVRPAAVMPRAQITGVAARDPARAEEYAAAHGIAKAFASYDELIESDEIDLVYCALPVSHHASWSIKALEAGKHVLCEKPFAMNSDEARSVLAAAERHDRRVIEAFHYRHHPAFQTCLEWIGDGRIGAITAIDAHFTAPIPDDGDDIRFRPQLGGGAMMDLGCYTLHWMQALMGSAPESITAEAKLTNSGVDEWIDAKLTFVGGVKGHLYTEIGAQAQLSVAMTITGEAGEITFVNPLAPHMGSSLACQTESGIQTAAINPISTYTYQLGDVIDALENGTALYNEGENILRQQSALDQVYEAAGLGYLRASQI